MTILKAEERNTQLKGKQLRRAGIIPGVLYDKDSKQSLNIQFSQKDVEALLKTNSIGCKVDLVIGKKKQMALLKEISYTTVTNKVEHLSFMPLIQGEPVNSIAHIVLLNKEKVKGLVQQSLFEISYKALPTDLIEKIEIDLEKMAIGDSIRVEDLEIAKNTAIEILDPLDSMICSIVELKKKAEETSESEQEEE